MHSSAYYLVVDAIRGDSAETYLLRIALASAPATAPFRDAILIGRMRPAGEREVVVNAIPFAASDAENVETFAEQVDPRFLPMTQATRDVTAIPVHDVEKELPAAFVNIRETLSMAGAQYPVFTLMNGLAAGEFRTTAIWAAIRAGWRDGYMLDPGIPN